MSTGDAIHFGPFRFDPEHQTLWRDDTPVALRPRAALVLKFFLERPAQLLSREEIIHGVWRGGHVTGNALRVCLYEIRQALDDPPQVARYLETEGRDGYRFVGLLPHLPGAGSRAIVVGRRRELDTLTARFARAARGSRQLVLIHGEAGTGKTTLVNHFIARVRQQEEVLILRGQGIETSGQGEALQPLLDALETLATVQDGTQLTQLRRRAPGWLSLLPHLVPPETLLPPVPLLSNTRLGRELSALLEALGDRTPVLLVLEDLHWSDTATLEILNILLQRAATARLLILGSLRPGTAPTLLPTLSMLRERLRDPGAGTEITLSAFSREEVEEYARRRLNDRVTPQLLELLLRRAGGHPLFTSDLLDFLLDGGLLRHNSKGWSSDGDGVGDCLPGRTQHLIDLQLERLPTEQQRLLAVASAVGVQFPTRIPATCLALPVEIIEQHCETLARHHHLLEERDPQQLPGEGLSGVYRFRHDIYRQVCYRRLGQIQRARLHQRVAELLEHDYAAGEVSAGELAHHFSLGQHWQRAVHYRLIATEVALARAAPREVVFHCERGLEELSRQCDPLAERTAELTLLVHLIIARTQMEGHASTRVATTLERAAALTRTTGSVRQRARVLWGQYVYHTAGQHPRGGQPALKRLLSFTRERQEPMLRMVAHHALGGYLFYHRTRLDWALGAFDTALALYDPQRDRDLPMLFGQDARVLCLGNSAWITALRGDFHGARQRCEAALAHARQLEHPYSLALARIFTLNTCLECDTPAGVEAAIDALQQLAAQHDFVFFLRICEMIRLGNAARQNQQVDWQRAMALFAQLKHSGAQLHQVGWWMLIDILFRAACFEECQRQLDHYLDWSQQTGQGFYLAEGYRLQGMLLRHRSLADPDTAGKYLQRAHGLARRQHNRLFELRAALELAQLWLSMGRVDAAHGILAELRDLLEGDCGHPAIVQARQLLQTLEYPQVVASC